MKEKRRVETVITIHHHHHQYTKKKSCSFDPITPNQTLEQPKQNQRQAPGTGYQEGSNVLMMFLLSQVVSFLHVLHPL